MAIGRQFHIGNTLLMCIFMFIFYVQLVHHEFWRDELNAWQLVCDSPTIPALLANVHFEAHPALWYLLLYPGTRITHDPWMMKIIQGAIGTGIYLMIGLASPFRRSEKVLIYMSYFVFFEYTVMSRMYGLMMLFALIYIWSRAKHPDWLVRNGAWLGLIACTDSMGILLSLGFSFEYIMDWYVRSKAVGARPAMDYIKAIGTYLVFLGLSVASSTPAKTVSWRTTGKPFADWNDAKHLWRALRTWIVLPWFPEHIFFPRMFWDMRVVRLHSFLLPIVLVLFWYAFRKQPRLLWMMILLSVAGTAFFDLIYLGSVRHSGIMYLAVMAAIWFLRYRGEMVAPAAYGLLVLGAIGGLETAYGQWARPFSDDAATAQWIRQEHLDTLPLIGTPDTHTIVDTYMKFSNRRDDFDPEHDIPGRLAQALRDLHTNDALFLTNSPLTVQMQQQIAAQHVQLRLLKKFENGERFDEHFIVYDVRPAPGL
jgi:hypothetical protein